ncbi:MAG: AAA domain-containing protein, partial [Deltaproteobacteria bacterium]|nr:AAA domain-containing protein [Deltaproteobacteria bacterium]
MKKEIPREKLEKIISDYNCSKEDAIQAFLYAGVKAEEAYDNELDSLLGNSRKSFNIRILSPSEIKLHLDKYVIGQEQYKKRLAIAAAYHFAMVKYISENPLENIVKRFRKKNTLTAGPSGSGKTYSVEVLGDLLQVPTLLVDATDYTEAGFVGKSADDMIRELIDLAPGKNRIEKARYISECGGLIFIDEFDKKAREPGYTGHDISRVGFQRSVLKLIERKQVSIDYPNSPAAQIKELMGKGGKSDNSDNMISTENILFILGGSFERILNNLDSIIENRIVHKNNLSKDNVPKIRGFSAESEENLDKKKPKNYIKEAIGDDYIKFGLIPEIVGRFPIRTYVNRLSKNNLVRIMKDTEDSILDQYELEFKLFDIKLTFTDESIAYVAESAENSNVGARALVNIWEDILTEFQYELPGSSIKHLTISEEVCNKPKDELLKMLKISPFEDYIDYFKREYGIDL